MEQEALLISDYFCLHSVEIIGQEDEVKARLVSDTNLDTADFLAYITRYAMRLRNSFPLTLPDHGESHPIPPLTFQRLRNLTTQGSVYAVIGKLQNGLGGIHTTAADKQQKENVGRHSRKHLGSPTDPPPLPPPQSPFQKSMLACRCPAGACFAAWREWYATGPHAASTIANNTLTPRSPGLLRTAFGPPTRNLPPPPPTPAVQPGPSSTPPRRSSYCSSHQSAYRTFQHPPQVRRGTRQRRDGSAHVQQLTVRATLCGGADKARS